LTGKLVFEYNVDEELVRVETELAREKTDDTAVEAVDAIDVVESVLASAIIGRSDCSARPEFDFLQGHLNEFCREGAALIVGSSYGSSGSSGNSGPEVVRSGTALRGTYCGLGVRGLSLYDAGGMLKSVEKLEKSTLIRELGRLSDSGANESVCVIMSIILR
jgi:hypothetical protein